VAVTVHVAKAKPTPTVVWPSYWHFAAERQEMFFKRLAGQNAPWTTDPILASYKFTNTYRASDRVSQYLIRNVIYGKDAPQNTEDMVFRILLFKLFNKTETWELLTQKLGPIQWKSYQFSRYDSILTKAMEARQRIYSAAYIMPPGDKTFGESAKHRNHLHLLERMMAERLPSRLEACRTMDEGFALLRNFPLMGDFLAYQLVTDLNYSPVVAFSEMDFVRPGPGAMDGIRKCFSSLGDYTPSELIRWIAERQNEEFAARGIAFRNLFGRPLQLIDCQGLFCETDKYARVAHPTFAGKAGRTRIKQVFHQTPTPINYMYPPKWGLQVPNL
jgi:hypothetical protein